MHVITKFEGNVFAIIYQDLYGTLETVKLSNKTAFHAIMSRLYSLVVYVTHFLTFYLLMVSFSITGWISAVMLEWTLIPYTLS